MKLKNKYGFTLIELLAVIVVLAIIALIATPIVMNTIKKSQKGAAERSADNYIEAVETAVAEERLSKNEVLEGEYQITSDGNLCRDKSTSCSDEEKIKIEMSGTKPTSGKIKITNGSVDQSSSSMTVGDYTVSYNSTKKTYEATEKGSTTPDTPSTTVVYRGSTDEIKISDTINPNDTSKFTKDASTLGKSYYLKHVLDKDNKVTESYACAIFNSKEYCLRGGNSSFYGYAENEADYTGNALILKQIEGAKIAGVSCGISSFDSHCSGGSVYFGAGSNGGVGVNDGGGNCYVNDDGSSSCASF
jgi:type IV pilus assembly protein PilA